MMHRWLKIAAAMAVIGAGALAGGCAPEPPERESGQVNSGDESRSGGGGGGSM